MNIMTNVSRSTDSNVATFVLPVTHANTRTSWSAHTHARKHTCIWQFPSPHPTPISYGPSAFACLGQSHSHFTHHWSTVWACFYLFVWFGLNSPNCAIIIMSAHIFLASCLRSRTSLWSITANRWVHSFPHPKWCGTFFILLLFYHLEHFAFLILSSWHLHPLENIYIFSRHMKK